MIDYKRHHQIFLSKNYVPFCFPLAKNRNVSMLVLITVTTDYFEKTC